MNLAMQQAADLVEAERSQIGHELHDSVLPLLFGASASLDSLIPHAGQRLTPDLVQRLEQTKQWIDQAMQIGRRLLTEIYPPELERTAWPLAAVDVVQRLLPREASRVHWQIDSALTHVLRPIAFACYRIAVEAVRNAITHGDAHEVIVTGTRDAGGLRLVICDNGTGFDPSRVSPDRFGLRTMQGRAQMVGGTLTIESSVGGSTCVQLTVPMVEATQ